MHTRILGLAADYPWQSHVHGAGGKGVNTDRVARADGCVRREVAAGSARGLTPGRREDDVTRLMRSSRACGELEPRAHRSSVYIIHDSPLARLRHDSLYQSNHTPPVLARGFTVLTTFTTSTPQSNHLLISHHARLGRFGSSRTPQCVYDRLQILSKGVPVALTIDAPQFSLGPSSSSASSRWVSGLVCLTNRS